MRQVGQSLTAFALLAAPTLRCGQVIDRIAVTVDSQVITQSRVLEEIRLAAFLNGEKPDVGPEARRRTAGRLVEQLLIRREMELTRYPAPPPSEIDQAIERLKRERFPEAQYPAALRAYEITEEELKQYLLRQAALLRFIEARFRPEVQVAESEVKDCYEKRSVQTRTPSEEARAQCEAALAAAGVDKAVDRWLRETRERVRIVYREEAFQ
jgi:hypothetical protein